MPCRRVRCEVCGKRHALIALEMVRDTSARMGNPSVAVTLTSADPDRDVAEGWCRDVEQVVRALRLRWPELQYLGFMEWTTGRGPRSGGRRRPHMHLLGRGLAGEHAQEAEAVVRRVWQERTGAHRVEVAPLRAAADGVAYLALHHVKPSQAAPEGWRGRRLRASRGWWGRDSKQLRAEATRAVADRAHRSRAIEERKAAVAELVHQGCPLDLAEDHIFGPEDAPIALPERESGVTVVRLRRAA